MLVLEGLVGLCRTVQLQLLKHSWSGHRLGFPNIEWFALEMNKIILSFLGLHPSTAFQTLVDCDGYSISSKGFLSIVVDTMVI